MISNGVISSKRKSGGSGTKQFLVACNFSGLLNNTGNVPFGFKFTVGNSPITVTELGRWKVSGDSLTHDLALWSNGTTSIATVTITTSGKPSGTWIYAAVTPVTLSPNTVYYITCQESGTDQWFDHSGVTYTSDAVCNNAAYLVGGVFTDNNPGVPESYGPVNFRYR